MTDLGPQLLSTVAYLIVGTALACLFALVVAAVVGPQAYRNGRAQGRRDVVDEAARVRRLESTPIHDGVVLAMRAHPAGKGRK